MNIPSNGPISVVNQGHIHMPGAKAMQVERLLLRELSGFRDQYYRPFVSVVTRDTIQGFQHLFHDSTISVAPGAMANISANVISPSASIAGNVAIANGWGSKRFQFILEISEPAGGGTRLHTVLTGITDRFEMTNGLSGPRLSPETRLYFNNAIEFTKVTNGGLNGLSSPIRLQHASQLLFNVNPFTQQGFQPNNNISMRPMDVLSHMQHRAIGVDMNSHGILDMRTSFQSNGGPKIPGVSTVKLSSRKNTNPAEYLARIVSGVQLAKTRQQTFGGDVAVLYDHAKQAVAEQRVTTKSIFQMFSKNTDFEKGKSITFRELEMMCHDVDRRMHFNLKDPNARFAGPTFQNTEGFNGSRPVDLIGARLSHAIPSLLMDCAMAYVSFEANNYTIVAGEYNVIINANPAKAPKPFAEGMSLQQQMEIFIYRLKTELLRDIISNSNIEIAIQVEADINNETLLSISFNREPFTPYLVPTCADNLTTPMVSSNTDHLNGIAADMDNLVSSVGLDVTSSMRGDFYAP